MNIKRHKIRVILAVIFVTFLCYIFSEGYAYRLMRTHAIAYKTYSTVYRPIIWLGHHNNYFDDLTTWYECLWYSDGEELRKFIQKEMSEPLNTNQPAELKQENKTSELQQTNQQQDHIKVTH